jgi:hypothetical protein
VFHDFARKYLSVNADLAIAAHMKRAEALLSLKRIREAQKEMQTTVRLYRRYRRAQRTMPEATRAVAQAEFMLASSTFDRYARYNLTAKGQKRLKRQLSEKLRRLKQVVSKYTDVVRRKQPVWGIASLYQVGRAYEHLIDAFERAGVPRHKFPGIQAKAVAHYRKAVEKSSELGCYNEYTLRAYQRLQVLEPESYPPTTFPEISMNGVHPAQAP